MRMKIWMRTNHFQVLIHIFILILIASDWSSRTYQLKADSRGAG